MNTVLPASSIKRCSFGTCPNIENLNIIYKRCSQCKKAIYCSEHCQKKDWKNHKIVCIPADSYLADAYQPISATSSNVRVIIDKLDNFIQEMKIRGHLDRGKIMMVINNCSLYLIAAKTQKIKMEDVANRIQGFLSIFSRLDKSGIPQESIQLREAIANLTRSWESGNALTEQIFQRLYEDGITTGQVIELLSDLKSKMQELEKQSLLCSKIRTTQYDATRKKVDEIKDSLHKLAEQAKQSLMGLQSIASRKEQFLMEVQTATDEYIQVSLQLETNPLDGELIARQESLRKALLQKGDEYDTCRELQGDDIQSPADELQERFVQLSKRRRELIQELEEMGIQLSAREAKSEPQIHST